MTFSIPDDADSEEAAAIVAAVRAHVAADATEEATAAMSPAGWAFAGRIEALQDRRGRPPAGLPGDPWRAAGRTGRF